MTATELTQLRQRIKSWQVKDMANAYKEMTALLAELDATRACLARLAAVAPRDTEEAAQARRMLDL